VSSGINTAIARAYLCSVNGRWPFFFDAVNGSMVTDRVDDMVLIYKGNVCCPSHHPSDQRRTCVLWWKLRWWDGDGL
jgi:hypothetical protein